MRIRFFVFFFYCLLCLYIFFFFKQKTAYEMRISDWSSDVCSSDLLHTPALVSAGRYPCPVIALLHSCVATWWEAVRGGPMPEDFNWRAALVAAGQIGRASCRERVCQYV